jgi:hypothetical protein
MAWDLTQEVLEAHGLINSQIQSILGGEQERDKSLIDKKNQSKNGTKGVIKPKKTANQQDNDKDRDINLAKYLLKRRLCSVDAPFSLKTVYSRLLSIGGTIVYGTRAPKKKCKTVGLINSADASKDNQVKILFGNAAPDFDILLRDLHPMVVAKDGWMTCDLYMNTLGSLTYQLRVCSLTELIVYLRFDSLEQEFTSSSEFLKQVGLII